MNMITDVKTDAVHSRPSGQLRALEFGSALGFAKGFGSFAASDGDRSFQSMLQQFEVILSYGDVEDPRVILQAMNMYLTSNQQQYGIELFTLILSLYADGMAPDTRAIYESALGVLRATYADHIPLNRRISWVKESFALIETALDRTGSDHPIPHWAAGMVYSQVPWFFFKTPAAFQHLQWLADRPETEPTYGFYREVYRQLAALSARSRDSANAEKWLKLSGYGADQPSAPLMGWFTTGSEGTAMAPRPVLEEIVPSRIFALYGFGFSDIYFVLSDDAEELIAIDAGTHPHSLKAAHALLLASHPDLPRISTAFVTHAHWDHIGGHGYLREHNPNIAIYGRSNYASVAARVVRHHSYQFFRGADFDHAWVESYAPTHSISKATTLTVGGTEVSLIPVTGGETEDAMLIHFPGLSSVFVGDVVMPWYGEPWVNEGFASSATVVMDKVLALQAKRILHGHHPLTRLYGSDTLGCYRHMHDWLVGITKTYVTHGYSSKDIIRLNLLPPGLAAHPEVTLAFVAARDNVIARVADELVGIWREDHSGQSPEGLDTITANERARLLTGYLGLGERQVVRVLKRMITGGDNELALQFAVAAEHAFGATGDITEVKAEVADRLPSIAQFTDPFRFTTYSEMIDRPHPAMPSDVKQS